jgi:hypothetical protein
MPEIPLPTELERYFAAQARALKLSPLSLETANPETVRAYCALVLNELAARGLIEGEHLPGCYAAARASGN